MAVITYTAKRSLITGHTEGTLYAFEVPISEFVRRPSKKVDRSEAYDGTAETYLHRLDVFYNVATPLIKNDALIAQIWEWLDSVAAGESFTIDPYGTLATPGPVNYTVEMPEDPGHSRLPSTFIAAFNFEVRVMP